MISTAKFFTRWRNVVIICAENTGNWWNENHLKIEYPHTNILVTEIYFNGYWTSYSPRFSMLKQYNMNHVNLLSKWIISLWAVIWLNLSRDLLNEAQFQINIYLNKQKLFQNCFAVKFSMRHIKFNVIYVITELHYCWLDISKYSQASSSYT